MFCSTMEARRVRLSARLSGAWAVDGGGVVVLGGFASFGSAACAAGGGGGAMGTPVAVCSGRIVG